MNGLAYDEQRRYHQFMLHFGAIEGLVRSCLLALKKVLVSEAPIYCIEIRFNVTDLTSTTPIEVRPPNFTLCCTNFAFPEIPSSQSSDS